MDPKSLGGDKVVAFKRLSLETLKEIARRVATFHVERLKKSHAIELRVDESLYERIASVASKSGESGIAVRQFVNNRILSKLTGLLSRSAPKEARIALQGSEARLEAS